MLSKKVGRPKGSGGGSAPKLSDDDVKRLLLVAKGGANSTRNHLLLQMCLSGLRVSEPLFLKLGDVVNERGEVQASFILPGENTKSGRTRRIYLTKAAMKALESHVAFLMANSTHNPLAMPLFGITPNYATTLVKQLFRDAGIVGTSHSLRRTAASKLQENGVGVRHIQEVLGHTSLTTTQVYLDKNPAHVQNAVQTLDW